MIARVGETVVFGLAADPKVQGALYASSLRMGARASGVAAGGLERAARHLRRQEQALYAAAASAPPGRYCSKHLRQTLSVIRECWRDPEPTQEV